MKPANDMVHNQLGNISEFDYILLGLTGYNRHYLFISHNTFTKEVSHEKRIPGN